mmetsp:Transcript_101466/g.282403  ORF Transcript_101466/g.282403 Transcript_101466/m.282403 type:complete len:215 (-) Transcript_101466:876-1520(-)
MLPSPPLPVVMKSGKILTAAPQLPPLQPLATETLGRKGIRVSLQLALRQVLLEGLVAWRTRQVCLTPPRRLLLPPSRLLVTGTPKKAYPAIRQPLLPLLRKVSRAAGMRKLRQAAALPFPPLLLLQLSLRLVFRPKTRACPAATHLRLPLWLLLKPVAGGKGARRRWRYPPVPWRRLSLPLRLTLLTLLQLRPVVRARGSQPVTCQPAFCQLLG